MEIMEIILLIAGGIIFVLSFLIPERKRSEEGISGARTEEEIRRLVSQELEAVKGHVDDVVEEAVTYAMEKTERSLERLSNEKIMAVNEYSDTVLAQIHKNHEETVFLYDMLNNKHSSLKNAISEVNRTVKEAEEAMAAFHKLTPGSVEPGDRILEAAPAEPEESLREPETGAGTMSKAASVTDGEDMPQDAPEEETDVKEKILKLYKEGVSAVDIARKLEMGTGEVNLIIGLYKNRQK